MFETEMKRVISFAIPFGEVPERLNGTVSKTVIRETVSRVRISPSPLYPRSFSEGGLYRLR